MLEERLREFARQRLGGRPIPDDLRTMLVAQWEGRTDIRDLLHITFLEPEETDPLLDVSYLTDEERADPEMRAVTDGFARMSAYLKLVAEGGMGWIGYWLHPDEPEGGPVPIIELDTEFQFWRVAGSTLVEACATGMAPYLDEPDEKLAFALLADRLAELGVPLGTRDQDALHEPELAVDPKKLVAELISAERVRRGLA